MFANDSWEEVDMWAIFSGIEGNLAAYEAVVADCQRHPVGIDAMYLIGDIVGPRAESEALVACVRSGVITPQVCVGWWEEQCFALHGMGTALELNALGGETIEKLWQSVSRETVQWLRQQHFGLVELDCLLIHGSTVRVDEALTPETSPWIMLDRLQRVGVNRLFCGRSGLSFDYLVQPATISGTVTTLTTTDRSQAIASSVGRVIGVGSVGRIPGLASYVIYNPETDFLEFKTISY